VNIITSQNTGGPKPGWLSIVKTTQARSKINQWFRKENRTENIQRGKDLLEAEAKQLNMTLTELLADGREEDVLNRFNCPDFESLCAVIGHGGLRERQVTSRLFSEYEKAKPPAAEEEIIQNLIDIGASAPESRNKKSGITVKDVGDVNVRFSKCCSPLPGDEIVGFITRGRGVSIHRSDCPNIINLEVSDRKRLIDASWQLPLKTTESMSYHAELRILCDDRDGLIYDVSRILKEDKVRVSRLEARSVTHESYILIGVEIHNREQLDRLKSRILKLPGTHDIERVIS
jgi:GTP pyrophosphokinase